MRVLTRQDSNLPVWWKEFVVHVSVSLESSPLASAFVGK